MKKLLFFGIIVAGIYLISSAKAEEAAEKVTQKAKETADAAGDYAKAKKDAAIKDAEKSFEEIKTKIGELSTSLKTKHHQGEAKVQEKLDSLKAQQNEVESRLSKFRKSSDKAWEDLRDGFHNAFEKLNSSLEKAKDDLKVEAQR